MASAANSVVISLLVVLVFASAPIRVAHGCTITIVNKCSYTVTTCAQGGTNDITQYQIGAGQSQNVGFGSTCSWNAGGIWPSITGQCANPPGSNGATDRNLANVAEITIGGANGLDYYDLSNVNAYTIGLGIEVTTSDGGECTSISCSIPNISTFCKGDNQLKSEPSGALTCINTDGTNNEGPTTNTEYFNTACPQAFSYPNDNSKTFTCNTGSNYQVTFCP